MNPADAIAEKRAEIAEMEAKFRSGKIEPTPPFARRWDRLNRELADLEAQA